MKINANQVSARLKGPLPNLIWLSGDEPLQLLETADWIRRRAREQGMAERQRIEGGANFNWQQLLDASASLSLFGDQRLIEVHLSSSKPGKKGAEVIQQLCRQADSLSDLFLFISPRFEAAQAKSAWVKALEQQGAVIQAWPVEAAQLPQWIAQRLKDAGVQADAGATQLLAEKVEGNLLAAAQEVEKLKLFIPAGEVLSSEKLLQLTEDASRYRLFDLADACLAGQPRRAVKILHGLMGEGTEAPLILWSLTRELRLVSRLVYHRQEGQSFEQTSRQLYLMDKRKSFYRQALDRHNRQSTHQLIQLARRCDQAIKGSGEPLMDLLLSLVYGLSGQTSSSRSFH